MVKSNQAVWAQNEMFLMLGHLMDPNLDANTLFTAFKKFHGWMLFVYLFGSLRTPSIRFALGIAATGSQENIGVC